MGSQNWWFGDPRTLLYRVKPLHRRVQWFLGYHSKSTTRFFRLWPFWGGLFVTWRGVKTWPPFGESKGHLEEAGKCIGKCTIHWSYGILEHGKSLLQHGNIDLEIAQCLYYLLPHTNKCTQTIFDTPRTYTYTYVHICLTKRSVKTGPTTAPVEFVHSQVLMTIQIIIHKGHISSHRNFIQKGQETGRRPRCKEKRFNQAGVTGDCFLSCLEFPYHVVLR